MTYEELSKDFMSKAYNGEINREVAMTVIRICALVECSTRNSPTSCDISNAEDVVLHWEDISLPIIKSEVLSKDGYARYAKDAKTVGIILFMREQAIMAKARGETRQ